METGKPLIAVTAGDPAGVGPEIVVRALTDPAVTGAARCLAVGDARVLRRTLAFPGMPAAEINAVADPGEAVFEPGTVNVLDVKTPGAADLPLGRVSARCGRAAFEYIRRAVELAMDGRAGAVATAPINKESLRAGGVPYIGHTEIFGALTGSAEPLTMFEVENLRIFFLTRHVSLRKACGLVTRESLVRFARRCRSELSRLGVNGGTMAVAGLNPHSGEHGLFGDEEVREIAPAVEELRRGGMDIVGPVGADSVFWQAREGRYCAVLSLYHDQGHIAAKTVDFYRTVSLTLGMPILRASVDHGTAFDIAGTGQASPVSMAEAILTAAKYAPAFPAGRAEG